jgi:hypothetical protein
MMAKIHPAFMLGGERLAAHDRLGIKSDKLIAC